MIDALGRFALMVAGYKFGEKYLSASGETPVQTWAVNADLRGPTLSLTQVRYHGKVFYRVYAVTNGNTVIVGSGDYPLALGILQDWQNYLGSGGTVEAWLAHNTRRVREIAALEKGYRR